MNIYLQFILAGLVSYLIGAFPTGVVMSKLLRGPDVRHHGSGHTGGTNTMRLLGARAGAAVTVLDALKGLAAWAIAYVIMLGNPYALPLAGALAVIGHCWPVYTKFQGGMGLATGGALVLVTSPLTIALAIPTWAVLFFVIFKKKHSPRCVALTLPIVVLLTLLFVPLAAPGQWLLVLVAAILVVRHLPDWNRVK